MHAFRSFAFTLVILIACSDGLQICTPDSKSCKGDACHISIPCYHGDCTDAGLCECDLCWRGDNCNEYVDNFLPEFNKEEETAIVSDPWSPEIVYTAQAYDGDLGSTCPQEAMICDCAETRYSITGGDPNKLFYINNLTGEVYVKEASRVVSGRTYNLTLAARSARGQISQSPNAYLLLRVVIDDLHHHLAQVLQQNALSWLGDDTLSRSKRSTEEGSFNTEFNFTLLTGELETMETGGRLDFRLEILIPKTDGMDLTVEFFTKEVGNGNYTPVLALFNVMVDEKPAGLSYSIGDQPHTEMLLSDEVMTAYDRAIVSFGKVVNTNSFEVPLNMFFSVTQIKNPATLFDNKYLVTAGAEYDKETYVWVGQSEVTVHNSTDDKGIKVTIDGPTEIPLDSAGVYTMITCSTIRSDNFTFEVIAPKEVNVVTVGNLGVKDFGENYDPVPQNIYFYNTTLEGSDEKVVYTAAMMNVGIMTNVGNNDDLKDDKNVINVTFAIYALNIEANLNKEVSFTTKVTVGRDVKHSDSFKVKLVKRVDESKTITARFSDGELTTTEVGVGDMAMYTLWSNLSNSGFADYVLEVDGMIYKTLHRLEPCSARLWKYKGSFDIPYLNTTFIDPDVVNGKYLFRFNRIHVTGQRTPSIYNDSMMYVHLIMKVSSMPVNNIGTKLGPAIRIGTQGEPEKKVPVTELQIQQKGDYQAPAMNVQNGVDWDYLYIGGAIVLNITMMVPIGQGYAEVIMEASGENNPPLPAVHVCRAELSDVGRNLPCLRMHQNEVNAKFTNYSKTDSKNRLKPDMTSVMLGDVGALPVEGKNTATVSVVVELPEGVVIKDDEQYPISSGLLITTNTIWSSMANYTMKKGPPPDLIEEKQPEASAHFKEEEKIVPGHLVGVEIWVDTKIQTITSLTIEVKGTTRDVSLCGLKVKSFGRNLPCVDKDTEPYYLPHDNPLDGNKVSGLNFSALSNIGFRSDPEHDRLVAIALVRISPSCKVSETELEWRVLYGGGFRSGTAMVKVDLDADTSDMSVSAKKPKALGFKKAYPNKNIAAGSPVVVDLEVSLEPGSLAPAMVQLKNADAGKKFSYDVCLGGIWFRGKNYPCFSPVQVESNFSSSGLNGERNDSAVYNLGLVCNTFVDNSDEENKVTVRVAMRPVDDGSLKNGDKFSLEGYATVGTHHEHIGSEKFTIARLPDQVETTETSVKLVNEEATPIRIHQRLWIPFNVTIPIDSVVKVSVEAHGEYKNNRAILTVHNIRLVAGGVNIPCPMLYPQPKVEFKPTGTTTQSDIITADIGYFTNLGLSHKMMMKQQGDDDLTIEVEVEMSDHPVTFNDEIFKLKFIAHVGTQTVATNQSMKVLRDGNERADLDVKVHVDNKKPYQSRDRINVTLTVVHTAESTAEPINATIRLYLPPYVVYDSNVFNNATTVGTVEFIHDFGGLDIVIPQFLFSDSATIIVSLLADPNNERGFGRGEVNATTPYRVLCLQNYREEPSPNPATTDTIVSCGPVDHVMYVVNSQECALPLGLGSGGGKIYKCQVSASSAAKKDTGPNQIRPKSKRGWSPALRLGPHKPYFQVDFLRTTRVSKLEFLRVDDTRMVTKYRMKYSHTGSDWLYANEVTDLVYNNKGKATDTLEKPVQTRFVRIVIEEAEKGDEDTKYIGLKMEMYGCYIGEKSVSVTCAKHDPTWYSDDKNKYGRHFSVDVTRDIVYFCDLEYDMENLVCFSSVDGGSSWRTLPRSIGGILGWDKKSGRTYAFDKRKRAYIASDDGNSWIAVSELEANNTNEKKAFIRSGPVPALTSEEIDMLDTLTGKWKATFDGLTYDGKGDPKARWSRCCKLTK